MLILAVKTDKPVAELYLNHDDNNLQELSWEADRQLADTIHIKIKEILQSAGKTWHDLEGLVVFKGPGSFTGLRIGAATFNALAYGLDIPIVGSSGEKWLDKGINLLIAGDNHKTVIPSYGGVVKITAPKK